LPRAAFLNHIIRIVSMVAQMTATAMTGLTKRICDITFPPMVPRAYGHAFGTLRAPARRPADPAEHYAAYPEGPTGKQPTCDGHVLARHHARRLD
jgi:hypothetical protein